MPVSLTAAHYLHWGWIQISPANLIVIVLMLVAVVAAIAFKMPDHTKGSEHHDQLDQD